MAQGSHDAWAAHALLPEPAGPDQLSGVLLLDRVAAHPGLRQAAPKPIGLSRPPEPSHPEPNRITAAQNPKRRTAGPADYFFREGGVHAQVRGQSHDDV